MKEWHEVTFMKEWVKPLYIGYHQALDLPKNLFPFPRTGHLKISLGPTQFWYSKFHGLLKLIFHTSTMALNSSVQVCASYEYEKMGVSERVFFFLDRTFVHKKSNFRCLYKDKGREFSFSAQPSFLTLNSTALSKFWLDVVTTWTTTKKSITFLQPIGDSQTRYVIPFDNNEPVSRLQQLDITMQYWWTHQTAREQYPQRMHNDDHQP